MTLAKASLVVAVLIAAASSAAGEGQPITEAMKPVMAAARIFALENHLHGDIAVADEDEGHIGRSFEVNHAPGEACTFTMRRRGGPVIETISFDRLSGEYHAWPQHGYARLAISGQPGAQCEVSGGVKRCSPNLDMLLMVEGSPSELDLARRALDYIFENVCRPAQLPF
ncbi:hypothetical protein [Bradyrhizobium sp. Tv2a-2]|uniref:hypothetical protein n=1 Tax=Bradyrhizobium sp. Tv2a-2 TaxID=113395 RepID=UPI00041862A9|nr:hypothetical protein [Bradyrhizobium sp. Tv2a-2]